MYVRKARAGSAPGYNWAEDGDVVEVHDDLAEQLLLIPGGGFSIAPAPERAPEPAAKEEFDEVFDRGEPVEVTDEPRKAAGRPKLPRDAKGNIIRN